MNSNTYMSEYVGKRYLILKLRAIEYLGGHCKNCGYDRYYGALEFHHRDPKQKELVWTKLRCRSWTAIMAELDKCDLLCTTCHREHHQIQELVQIAKDFFARKRRQPKPTKLCAHCNTEFIGEKFCSNVCVALNQRQTIWPANLPELVNQSSLSAVGRSLGVSGNAVKKHLVKYHKNATGGI